MQCYDWPGNIRELQNVIERSVILSSGEVFSVDEFWPSQAASRTKMPAAFRAEPKSLSEQEIIKAALAESRGRVSDHRESWVKLDMSPSTLEDKIKSLENRQTAIQIR